MKRILLITLSLISVLVADAQFVTPSPGTTLTNDKVGIGAVSPTERLTVGDPAIPYNAGTGVIKLKFDSGNGGGGIGFEKETFNTGGLRFYTQYGFGTMTEQMRITSDGKFGIGVSNPTSKLVVASGTVNNSIDQTLSILQNTGVTSYGGYIGQRVVSANTRQGMVVSAVGSLTLNAQGYNIDFVTGGITPTDDTNLKMRIAANGNVGIGITDPGSYKLAVEGTIHSQGVQVDMIGWSDYVFEPSYRLTSLTDVKTYINQNHHLPDVPSAAQVKKEGIDLGEMNAKLLKKIEELTLYLIEKDKEVANISKKMDDMQAEITQLKKDHKK